MDVLLRVVAIFTEVLLLASIMCVLLSGALLTIIDLGLRAKYKMIVTMALVTTGCIVVVFFIAHLTAFYPDIFRFSS